MRKSRTEILAYINDLDGYEGYVQFSHRPIDIKKDVFVGRNPQVEDEVGFVYEAHFANGKESIGIKQVNDTWLVSSTDIENVPTETFVAIADLKVNMAQIWIAESDTLCEDMEVLKLKKVVFSGFAGGEK
ncbi:MAG: TIGR04423 family type III CRISPR-associated protein [Sulfurovum sp.]|nr:TIGR04423 family type III CRISPR-associated protein [Sulfurovum sp.]